MNSARGGFYRVPFGTIPPLAPHRQLVRRRTADAGFKVKLGCHVFRATGITAYLEAGGSLENAQAMAARESPRTIISFMIAPAMRSRSMRSSGSVFNRPCPPTAGATIVADFSGLRPPLADNF